MSSLTFGWFRRESAGINLDQVSPMGNWLGARTSAPSRAPNPTFAVQRRQGGRTGRLPAVTAAIAQWKFSPALVNGLPVARKVVLPVNIVDSFDKSAVAMK